LLLAKTFLVHAGVAQRATGLLGITVVLRRRLGRLVSRGLRRSLVAMGLVARILSLERHDSLRPAAARHAGAVRLARLALTTTRRGVRAWAGGLASLASLLGCCGALRTDL